MKQCAFLPGIGTAAAMLLLILDSAAAVQGAAEGVELCLRTVIPSLFPFFFLSGILVSSMMGVNISVLRPLGVCLGMPEGSESLLISGFLGGYPVGAKAVHDAWASGALKRADAEHLLSFCSNAGPAFLFGMAAPVFSDPAAGWVLWGIHILSALTTAQLLYRDSFGSIRMRTYTPLSLPDAMKSAVSVTAQVCGWIILFRVMSSILSKWFLWRLPDWGETVVIGMLELANGCLMLPAVTSEDMRFLVCSFLLSFGGICVLLQTVSVTTGLSLRHYCTGKLLQSFISILYSLTYLAELPFLLLLPPVLLLLPKKSAKKGGNREAVIV